MISPPHVLSISEPEHLAGLRLPPSFALCCRVSMGLEAGSLEFALPDGRVLRFEGRNAGPDAKVNVRNFRFARRALIGGDIGFAEGYMAGEWDTPDLSAVLELFSRNLDGSHALLTGKGPLTRGLNLLRHFLSENTRSGARRNILAHYDLGNRFYQAWLDPTMTYSSARFVTATQDLKDAQLHKYRTLADLIDLKPGEHVLEIGSGWGGFAEYAAKERHARVTTITISDEQYSFAKKRLFDAGLADRTEVRLSDYRDVDGVFDKVASIEMFEAVGERYWPAYFDKVHSSLAPGGRAGLQIITIREDLFERYRKRADFIQRYVFPGGMLPTIERLRQETKRAGLDWAEAQCFGRDYARTLAEWARTFLSRWDDIRQMGFDERFRRLWGFYLSYCEAGFRTGRINVAQIALKRA